jgi:transposase
MKDYIGIDISKSTLDVYDGKKSYKFENNETGFKKTIALLRDVQNVIFIFEPTGVYSYAITEFCSTKSIPVVMVGPKESRDYARSIKARSKTDKIDAKVLYKYKSQIEPNMVKVPVINKQAIKVQEMLNVYEGIQSSKQRFKNQIESISDSNKDLLRTVNKIITTLDKEAMKVFNKIELLLLNDKDIRSSYDALLTIPAVGQKSALYLAIFFLKYPLANAKEITALTGLDPVMRDSGLYRGKQRISKQGGQQLRDLLYLPTLCAIQHNDRIKIFYTRLTSNAKTKKLAVIAAMRKLVLMAFSLFKSKDIYQPLVVQD